MLGQTFSKRLQGLGIDFEAPTSKEFDFLNIPRNLNPTLSSFSHILNAAAFTDVELAETETELAMRLNCRPLEFISKSARDVGAELFHVSTDYVFDGEKGGPYLKSDFTNPINFYGKSKECGEIKVLGNNPDAKIIRTSWLYGPGGNCFPAKIRSRLESGEPVSVVDDQYSTPTSTEFLTDFVLQLSRMQEQGGIFHGVPLGRASWFEFSQLISEGASEGTVLPISSNAIVTKAKRPRNSQLVAEDWTTVSWQEAWMASSMQKIISG